MHKTFYASGFLYHSSSQQILLQQKQTIFPIVSPWIMFEKQHAWNKDPDQIFKNLIFDILNIKINNFNKIYSYTKDYSKKYSLFYLPVDKLLEFNPSSGHVFRWFSFSEVSKIKTDLQTKHDIIIGQRVIEALKRENSQHLQKLIEDALNE